MEKTQYAKRKNTKKYFLLNLDITAWLAILVMSLVGSVAAYLYHFNNGEKYNIGDQSVEVKDTETKIHYTADIDGIVARCKTMVSAENSFVVFEHGTCVRLVEPISDHAESAKASLKILSSPNLPFSIKPLNNNNYLIVFNDYLFCWLSAKDIAELKDVILTNPSLAVSSGDPKSIQDLPEFEKRIGKFARFLMLEDARSLEVKKIIRAQNMSPDGR